MMTGDGDAAARNCIESMRERAFWSVNLYSMLWDWRTELILLVIVSSLTRKTVLYLSFVVSLSSFSFLVLVRPMFLSLVPNIYSVH